MDMLHFLRPWAFLLLIPMALVLIYSAYKGDAWGRVLDPHLMRFQLGNYKRRYLIQPSTLMWIFASLLSALVLAGPVWERQNVPVHRTLFARILLLDLSQSMNAKDISPSRLARARFKVHDILEASEDAQVALIVFAARPYTLSPLTEDVDTLIGMVPDLSTDIIPARSQGSDISAALEAANQLLLQANAPDGEIILIGDSAPNAVDIVKASGLHKNGYRTSVMAVGTEQGSVIPTPYGNLRDAQGRTVIAGVDTESMRQLALAGGGEFVTLTDDNRDITRLLSAHNSLQVVESDSLQQSEQWVEYAPWLLLLLLPYCALWFRRGLL